MTTIVKNNLNRLSFEGYLALTYVGSDPVVQGSRYYLRVEPRASTVTYAPYKVPGWKQKIASGLDATSVLIGTRKRVEYSRRYTGRKIQTGSGFRYDWTYGGDLLTTFSSVPDSTPSTLPLAGAKASEKFVADYYDKTRSIRGASSLAEATSTIRGLASPAKAIRKEIDKFHSSLSKRLKRSPKDAAKVIGGSWLEWQFGVKPLVSDANAAADAVNRLRDGDFRASIPIRGVGMDEVVNEKAINQGVSAVPNGIASPGSIGVVDSYLIDRTFVTIRGAVRVAPPGSEVPPAMQFGLGFEDVLPAAWEAIPWSFFVDYFVNVSSVIDSWSMLWSNLSWANRTVRNSRVRMVTDIRKNPDQSGLTKITSTISGGRFLASSTTTLRSTANPADLAPPLRIRLPTGGTKWANIAALATMYKRPY